MKILCLGNEFIEEDSLAKRISKILSEEIPSIDFINIDSSFELLDYLQDEVIIFDVVQNLKKVRCLRIDDLHQDRIHTVHDLDASFFLQLLDHDVKIIGIPQDGDLEEIKKEVQGLLVF